MFELGSTRWTSTSPHPFGPAPGAGLAEGRVRRPRNRGVTGNSFESGFAADPVGAEYTAPEETVTARWPVTVKQRPLAQGEIPAALVQVYCTDRGLVTAAKLEQGLLPNIKINGFKVSRAVKFEPVNVTWGWQHVPDFYYPVVKSPSSIAGMRYAGNALTLPVYTTSSADLAKLPGQLYVFTFAVTSDQGTMTDADAAKLLSIVKQGLANTLPGVNAYANTYFTRLGAAPNTFDGVVAPDSPIGPVSPIAKLGISTLLLIVAYNMVSPHIGAPG